MKGAAFVNITVELLSLRVYGWCLDGFPHATLIVSDVCSNVTLDVGQGLILIGSLSGLLSLHLLLINISVLALIHSGFLYIHRVNVSL